MRGSMSRSQRGAEENELSADALRRRQESLHRVIESISGELELRPLLTRVVRHACELLGADVGLISLMDEERDVIRIEALYQLAPTIIGYETPPDVGLAGLVYQTRQPHIVERHEDLPGPLGQTLRGYAVIGIPILWRDRMIGFFGVGAAPPYRFTEADAEILSLFAKHAGVAIENARLFAETHRTLEETRLLYQTSQRLAAALDEDEAGGGLPQPNGGRQPLQLLYRHL